VRQGWRGFWRPEGGPMWARHGIGKFGGLILGVG
jgi:hypothetical protein